MLARRRVRLRSAAAVAAALVLLALGLPASAARGSYVGGFLAVPYASGTNSSLEPALATSPEGTLWAASNFSRAPCKQTVSACGADVWTSNDAGHRWRWVGNPFAGLVSPTDGGFGGYDSDIAVAPERNAAGHYNIYVTSLWSGSNSVAVSPDDGKTWSLLPVASPPGTSAGPATVPALIADRPWLAADGPCTAYLAYNYQPGNVTALQIMDGCTPVPRPVSGSLPFAPLDQSAVAGAGKISGRFTVDTSPTSPYKRTLYYPAVASLDGPTDLSVMVSVSSDGGRNWAFRRVAPYPSHGAHLWPVTVATDAAGAVYTAWHDASNAWLAVSHDGARTWTRPRQLNLPDNAAVYPTVAAGSPGQVVVAWYGTDHPGPSDNRQEMGKPFARNGAVWTLVVSRSHDGARTMSRPESATGPVHRGLLCTSGSACSIPGSRALLDCFGVSLDLHGRFAAVFTDSLPRAEGAPSTSHTNFVADR